MEITDLDKEDYENEYFEKLNLDNEILTGKSFQD
jgi:hypothetical protein